MSWLAVLVFVSVPFAVDDVRLYVRIAAPCSGSVVSRSELVMVPVALLAIIKLLLVVTLGSSFTAATLMNDWGETEVAE